jgi:hypothetical protein
LGRRSAATRRDEQGQFFSTLSGCLTVAWNCEVWCLRQVRFIRFVMERAGPLEVGWLVGWVVFFGSADRFSFVMAGLVLHPGGVSSLEGTPRRVIGVDSNGWVICPPLPNVEMMDGTSVLTSRHGSRVCHSVQAPPAPADELHDVPSATDTPAPVPNVPGTRATEIVDRILSLKGCGCC